MNTSLVYRSSPLHGHRRFCIPVIILSLCVLAACGSEPTQQQAAPDSLAAVQDSVLIPADTTQPTRLPPEEIADRLAYLFDRLDDARQNIPRDTFDPEAVVATVGADPEALFAWVRDQTVLVPYRGALRGAQGVLMDRVGNSLDRALLLHTLLQAAGHEARLAQGTLTQEQAVALLDSLPLLPDPFTEPPETDVRLDTLRTAYTMRFDLDEVAMQERRRAARAQRQRAVDQMTAQVYTQTKALAALLEPPDPETAAGERAWQVQALQDHWWVQWHDSTAWIDLDPAPAEAAPHQTLTEATATTQPNGLHGDMLHTVAVHVVIESAAQGMPEEHVALFHTLVPARLMGRHVVLRH